MEFLLAGPILRRVEPNTVNVWVACSEAFSAKLSLYESNVLVNATTLPAATFESANIPAIKIGTKLFLNLITLTLPGATVLNPVSLYSYNITFTKAAGGTETFHSLNLLDDSADGVLRKNLALGYTKNMLPSFVLPAATLANIQVVHGSCRKCHGLGRENLNTLDNILKKAVTGVDPTKRPQQLHLTGDQIYADEVGTPIMRFLMPLANELIGKDESLTLTTGNVNITATNFPLYSRQDFLVDTAKFTSGAAQNHLMAFGEYCAMYLMCWSNNAWPDAALSMPDTISDADLAFVNNIPAAVSLAHLPQSFKNSLNDTNAAKQTEKRLKEVNRRKKEYREELESIVNFRKSLPKVKRALANIPVYMMMDDHEITDDWYLTKSWKQQTLSNTVGLSIIRNGLIAYSLFQDWGNDPSSYLTGGKQTLLANAQQLYDSTNPVIPKPSILNATEALIGLQGGDGTVKWHFKVATGPTFTLFLDTRTRRQFDRMTSAPGLLKQEALEEQVPTPASLLNPEAVFIVSPAPVLGMALLEEVIQPAVKAIIGPSFPDFEAWSLHGSVFEKFLDRISAFKKVILLSGDVHFAFTMHMDYFKKKTAPETGYSKSKIVQLVSSALKNEFEKVQAPAFVNARINQLQAAALLPAERLAWKDKLAVNVTGDVTFSNRMRMKNEPVLLSPGPAWTPATNSEGIPNPNPNTVGPAPDWAWKFDSVMDIRPEAARPENIRMKIIDSDAELATDPKLFYEKIMERHIDNSKKHVSRRFVWNNNLGVVNFKMDGADLVVEHHLWHHLADDSGEATADDYTLHKVKLIFAADSELPTIP